jgi:hypothetical protein
MRIGPLSLFIRTQPRRAGSWTVAAWHWPWSLTWRWVFSRHEWYTPPGRQGFSFWRTYRGSGFNFHACFNLPLIGHWSIQTQPNMRDQPPAAPKAETK